MFNKIFCYSSKFFFFFLIAVTCKSCHNCLHYSTESLTVLVNLKKKKKKKICKNVIIVLLNLSASFLARLILVRFFIA